MTTLKERLTTIFVNELKEGHENSKEMIASNSTSFDEMGMAHTAPGEFAQEEITDHSNLENTGSMANDTEFSGKEDSGCKHCAMIATATIDNADDMNDIDDEMDSLASDIVDISVKDDEDDENFDIDVEDDEEDEDIKELLQKAHESVNTSLLNTFKKKLSESNGDYAAPRDFVPDTRIHTAAVLEALKDKIREGSEGIHVDQDLDEDKNKIWIVTQIDKNKLPETLEVMGVKLKKKDGNKYIEQELDKDFPLMK